MYNSLIEKAKTTHNLSVDEIVEILSNADESLYAAADEVRKKYVGDDVHLRGLIEFSNICKNPCEYCGLRVQNKDIERYYLSNKEIIDTAKNACSFGYKTVVLQSGESDIYSIDDMEEIITNIKKLGLAITLSLGEKTREEYEAYRSFGADRYLLRIETTNENLYKMLHPNMDFNNRVNCLKIIRELGYELGTGIMVGLPGQTLEMIAKDILFFKKMDADMIGIGPFISHPKTPLKDEENGDFYLTIKVMSMIRLLLPDINLPATTAMETLNPNGRIIALRSGANVVMPNVMPVFYRPKYEIYPNKICINDSPDKCSNCIRGKIRGIGRGISETEGTSKHYKK